MDADFLRFAKSVTLKSADPRSGVLELVCVCGGGDIPHPNPLRPGGRQNPAAEPSEGSV